MVLQAVLRLPIPSICCCDFLIFLTHEIDVDEVQEELTYEPAVEELLRPYPPIPNLDLVCNSERRRASPEHQARPREGTSVTTVNDNGQTVTTTNWNGTFPKMPGQAWVWTTNGLII